MSWARQVFSTELRKLITYRIDFWIQFAMSIFANVGVAYFLWRAIFDYKGVDTMRGYSFAGLMLYYVMVPLISRMIQGPSHGMIAREIYDGSLTRYLIYPVSFFSFKFIQFFANTVIYFAQLIIAIALFVLFFGKPIDTHFSFLSLFLGVISILCAGFMAFTLSALFEMIAFWAEKVWSLLVMVRFSVGLLGGAMIPLSFFPGKIERILAFLPFRYIASFPINTMLGKVSFSAWLEGITVILFWWITFFVLSRVVWHKGKYKYTGVGI